MKPSVYLETTIISYLTARPSRDVIVSGFRQTTRKWWEHAGERYDLFVSLPILAEISKGDANAAQKRIDLVAGLPVILRTLSSEIASKRSAIAQVTCRPLSVRPSN